MEPSSAVNDELKDRLRFETLLADLFARFVNVPADRLDQEISNAQRAICETLGLEHSAFWQIPPDGPGEFVLVHLVRDPALPTPPNRIRGTDYFPWAQAKIQRKELVAVPDMTKLPPEAATDRQSWEYFCIKSALAIPLYVGSGPVLGVLSFDDPRQERDWPEPLLKRFQLIAQVFANALDRKHSEQKLRDSETRLTMAAASANAGIWTIETETGRIWATEKAYELYGLSPHREITVESFLKVVHAEDRAMVRRVIEEAIRSGKEAGAEYRILLPDGCIRWILARGCRQQESHLEPARLMGVSTDITEAKRVEHELAELREKLEAESEYLKEEIRGRDCFDEIIGQSKALNKVFQRIEQVSKTDSIVLITGETGTGKQLVALALHNLSRRKDRLMVEVDCASLPPTLIENELFGREKGAYTGALAKQVGRFELANGSTLFLDEVGELPLEVQAKLLRAVQDGQFERLGSPKTLHVDVRVIAATHRDLPQMVKDGSFREDLFYRLNVFPIHVPPLRERLDDIPLLTWAFVRELERKMAKKIETISKKSMDALRSYSWPGNVRELRNVVEQSMILTSGTQLNLQMPALRENTLVPTLQGVKYRHILSVLEKTDWRVKGPGGAAEILGMRPTTLYSAMQRLGIRSNRRKYDTPN